MSTTSMAIFSNPLFATYSVYACNASFGTDIEDRLSLGMDYKTTPRWAWPGSRDPISKFWDPLITFERLELSVSNLVQT